MNTDLNAKYGLNPAHSEVVAALPQVAPCKTLDMGCGTGRNSLYLAQRGYGVTAVDINANALNTLQSIVQEEGLTGVKPQVYDLNEANLPEQYGLIVCTVTLMFLQPENISSVLTNMQ